MEEAPEKGKESSHSAHANGMKRIEECFPVCDKEWLNMNEACTSEMSPILPLILHTCPLRFATGVTRRLHLRSGSSVDLE
jgi:hypothetical protein